MAKNAEARNEIYENRAVKTKVNILRQLIMAHYAVELALVAKHYLKKISYALGRRHCN